MTHVDESCVPFRTGVTYRFMDGQLLRFTPATRRDKILTAPSESWLARSAESEAKLPLPPARTLSSSGLAVSCTLGQARLVRVGSYEGLPGPRPRLRGCLRARGRCRGLRPGRAGCLLSGLGPWPLPFGTGPVPPTTRPSGPRLKSRWACPPLGDELSESRVPTVTGQIVRRSIRLRANPLPAGRGFPKFRRLSCRLQPRSLAWGCGP